MQQAIRPGLNVRSEMDKRQQEMKERWQMERERVREQEQARRNASMQGDMMDEAPTVRQLCRVPDLCLAVSMCQLHGGGGAGVGAGCSVQWG